MAARLLGYKRQSLLMGKKNHRAIEYLESFRPSRCDQSKPITMTLSGSETTTTNLTISLDNYKRRKTPLDQDGDLQLCSQPLKVILALKTFTGCNPIHKAKLALDFGPSCRHYHHELRSRSGNRCKYLQSPSLNCSPNPLYPHFSILRSQSSKH